MKKGLCVYCQSVADDTCGMCGALVCKKHKSGGTCIRCSSGRQS